MMYRQQECCETIKPRRVTLRGFFASRTLAQKIKSMLFQKPLDSWNNFVYNACGNQLITSNECLAVLGDSREAGDR